MNNQQKSQLEKAGAMLAEAGDAIDRALAKHDAGAVTRVALKARVELAFRALPPATPEEVAEAVAASADFLAV